MCNNFGLDEGLMQIVDPVSSFLGLMEEMAFDARSNE